MNARWLWSTPIRNIEPVFAVTRTEYFSFFSRTSTFVSWRTWNRAWLQLGLSYVQAGR